MSCCCFFLNKKISTLEGLPKAVDNFESIFNSQFGFRNDEFIIFFDDGSSFRVTQDDPLKSNIFEMFRADLSGVGSKVVVGAVLCGDLILELLVLVEGKDGGDV